MKARVSNSSNESGAELTAAEFSDALAIARKLWHATGHGK